MFNAWHGRAGFDSVFTGATGAGAGVSARYAAARQRVFSQRESTIGQMRYDGVSNFLFITIRIIFCIFYFKKTAVSMTSEKVVNLTR